MLTVNSLDGNIVETDPRKPPEKAQVAFRNLAGLGAGALFGLAVAPDNRGVYFVDDTNSGCCTETRARHAHVRASRPFLTS